MRREWKAALAVLLLPAALLLGGCNKLRARDQLNKGVRAFKAAQYERAIEHFKTARDLDPSLLNARLYLATAYASQFVPGNPSDLNRQIGQNAIEGFLDVLQKDPKNVTALGYLASLYFGMAGAEKDDKKQKELFQVSTDYRRQLMEIEPQNPVHPYSVSVIYWTLSYKPRATVRNNLGLKPDQPLPRRERERLLAENGAIVDDGIAMAQKALDLNPRYLDAIAYMNLLLREKADLVESAAERQRLLTEADSWFEKHKRIKAEEAAAAAQ